MNLMKNIAWMLIVGSLVYINLIILTDQIIAGNL